MFAVEYRKDAKYFATAGKDACVRIYDEETNSLEATLRGGNNLTTAGHANRIFSVIWAPFDENVLLSGGWDNTVQIWDRRQKHAVRRIFGPHICGDALDVDYRKRVLTGSWRQDNQIQLWDFDSGRLIETIPLPKSPTDQSTCSVYSARFCDRERPGMIIYGGSGSNEARILDTESHKELGAITGLEKPIFASSITSDLTQVAFAGSNGSIYVLGMDGKA